MFQKPPETKTPVVAYRTVTLDRTGKITIPYHVFESQANVSDPSVSPGKVVALIDITGPTALYILDTTTDSIYARASDVILRGLNGSLTPQESQDIRGMDALIAATAGATRVTG